MNTNTRSNIADSKAMLPLTFRVDPATRARFYRLYSQGDRGRAIRQALISLLEKTENPQRPKN